jgi:hypothetical protein
MPSTHLNASQLIRRGLYDGLCSFGELEQRISALGDENTKVVGDAFEIFVEAYLATQQKLQAESNWLVGQVPLDIRQRLNLPNEGGYRLGAWVSAQRTDAEKLLPERRRRLDELGFVWDPRGVDWEAGFVALVEFKEREGHCRVSLTHIESGFNLGRWVSNQRNRSANKMSLDRRRRLDELGFVWDGQTARWEIAFSALVKFKDRNGHCRVPQGHLEGDINLGRWVSLQRSHIDQMSAERKKRLDEVGFVWNPYGVDWENGFAALVTFKARKGHCNVPYLYTENDFKLGAWVSQQRSYANKMPPDRRKRLDEIGFLWDARRVFHPGEGADRGTNPSERSRL